MTVYAPVKPTRPAPVGWDRHGIPIYEGDRTGDPNAVEYYAAENLGVDYNPQTGEMGMEGEAV